MDEVTIPMTAPTNNTHPEIRENWNAVKGGLKNSVTAHLTIQWYHFTTASSNIDTTMRYVFGLRKLLLAVDPVDFITRSASKSYEFNSFW